MAETAFRLQRVDAPVGPIAIVTMDNGEDWRKPTTFGPSAFASLAELLPALQDGGWSGLVLTGKPLVFAAGADLEQFPLVTTAELARRGARAGHDAFGAIAALPYPTLAAINGACLGGGLELALHCDFRTVASSVRHIGFPEVALGIVPGWGGTQLAPRVVGAARAVELIVQNPLEQNRLVDGEKAVAMGLADALLEPVEFLDESLAWLVERIAAGAAPREAVSLEDAAEVCRKARFQVDDKVHGAAPAPYRALDLVAGAATWSIAEGYAAEEDALAELLPGPKAQASVYAYGLVERRVKRGVGIPEADSRRVARVGVVGAGLMATQLASLFLRRMEVPVVLTDVDADRVEGAIETIRADLARQAAKGRLHERKARFLASIVSGGVGPEHHAGCDLVLEAVFEELAVKRAVFRAAEAVVSAECLLLTNTSSLSVAGMAEGLAHPERVAGMHFFNPVAVLPLVELVRTPATDDVTLRTVWDTCGRLGKRGVLVADAPAFVVNRLLTRMTSVLMGAFERGNTIEETDEAALRLGLPMAPSMLLGLVGPRVANHVLHTLHDAFPDRFPVSEALAAFAEGDDEWEPSIEDPLTVDEIHDAVLVALADEIRHLLEEQVVGSVADVDTCMLLGAGWPFFLGGISRHLDETGVSERVNGARFTPSASSRNDSRE